MLVVSCVITMIPNTVFAEFTTDSSTSSGGGKKYNTLTNIVNVGYRISLYYTGKDDTTMVIDKSWILTKISMTEDGVSLEDI